MRHLSLLALLVLLNPCTAKEGTFYSYRIPDRPPGVRDYDFADELEILRAIPEARLFLDSSSAIDTFYWPIPTILCSCSTEGLGTSIQNKSTATTFELYSVYDANSIYFLYSVYDVHMPGMYWEGIVPTPIGHELLVLQLGLSQQKRYLDTSNTSLLDSMVHFEVEVFRYNGPQVLFALFSGIDSIPFMLPRHASTSTGMRGASFNIPLHGGLHNTFTLNQTYSQDPHYRYLFQIPFASIYPAAPDSGSRYPFQTGYNDSNIGYDEVVPLRINGRDPFSTPRNGPDPWYTIEFAGPLTTAAASSARPRAFRPALRLSGQEPPVRYDITGRAMATHHRAATPGQVVIEGGRPKVILR